ncbi:glycosyltransferase [Nonomuraea sp. NPDC048892]|uniref:glycosyltransferase n=1 Tax=Nonomuraea sp. NPDC048892 TaxID=3154624 RepID=UPI0033E24BBF
MITVVIPTIGRATLRATVAGVGPGVPVIVVDDRKGSCAPLGLSPSVRVVRSGGRGPAAARNAGWRAAGTPWVVFLDDDVVPGPGWAEAAWKDLVDLPDDVGGSQGRIVVPLPAGRRPADAERNTAGLAGALWATADMAYRRAALEAAGGFDERFPRAYREDADLALRVRRAGWRLVRGGRVSEHPVRADGFWASVRFQRGNADDALMRRLHGPGWRTAIGDGPGRLRTHAATTAAALTALLLTAAAATPPARAWRRPVPAGEAPAQVRRWRRSHVAARILPVLAVAVGGVWAGLTAEFAWRRIAPGPRTPGEVLRMAVTSVLIPPVAVAYRLRGEWKVRR